MGLGLRKASSIGACFPISGQLTTFQTHGGCVDLFPHSVDPNKENNGTL